MSKPVSPVKENNVDMTINGYKSSSDFERYNFNRWLKADLIDLSDKLKLDHVPSSAKKYEIIEKIEEDLYKRKEPLDTVIDFPELKDFFDNLIEEGYYNNGDLVTAPIIKETKVTDSPSEDNDTNYNKLNFKDDINDDNNSFKFNLQEKFCDIIESTKQINENVQDFFSSLITITIIFQIIEAILLIQDFFQNKRNNDYNLIVLLTVWGITYVGLPILFAYYFNFIRYDLMIEIDPMMLNITKGLIFLLLQHSHLQTLDTNHIIDHFNSNSSTVHKICDCFFMKYLGILSSILGNVPFIFSIVGALITLYVL
ncbi:hypothetical protein C6P45_002223 [Maudiozyma exigua]|uniref:Uncharacterized protein n=1 Tax=Maudiozyma exigua TaxID=34358 RepID=A0A9P7B4J1_MAUEX|nr:hypothetical protein C6P45_002223 [Kazachstania exigua]